MAFLPFVLFLMLCITVLINSNTIIGAKCVDGIILACDNYPSDLVFSSSSLSPLSSFISTRFSKNLFLLNNHISIGCISDRKNFNKLFAQLRKINLRYKVLYNKELSIQSIARYSRKLIYHNFPTVSVIIGGYSTSPLSNEDKKDLPVLSAEDYQLYQIAERGSLFSEDFFVCGGGGDLSYSLLLSLFEKDDSPVSSPFEPKSRGNLREKSSFDPFRQNPSWLKKKGSSITVKEAMEVIKKGMKGSLKKDHCTGGTKPVFMVLSKKNNIFSTLK
jgi:20S proteasome alpha/beta subunit